MTLEIQEKDEAGNLVATYVSSQTQNGERVDIIKPEKTKSYAKQVLDVFLPAGYPNSVTKDYLECVPISLLQYHVRSPLGSSYQIYDSLQAFSSSIARLLSSRAVLQGVGVGDASASPTAALLVRILQDSTGNVATILFAHKLGTALEPECKMWRFAADIFNDTAILLDCLSPVVPYGPRVFVLSLSSMLRALTGVAAGSSKATLSAHFARWGNLGELNAKDSSQETVIELMGMLVGSAVVGKVQEQRSVWMLLLLLLSVHLWMNYKAVRAIKMRTLNRHRASIVFLKYFEQVGAGGKAEVLTPEEASAKEKLFETGQSIKYYSGTTVRSVSCSVGVSMETILQTLQPQRKFPSRAFHTPGAMLQDLTGLYKDKGYLLASDEGLSKIRIAFVQDVTSETQLESYAHAVSLTMRKRRQKQNPDFDTQMDVLAGSLTDFASLWPDLRHQLIDAGWDVNTASLETRPGSRLSISMR